MRGHSDNGRRRGRRGLTAALALLCVMPACGGTPRPKPPAPLGPTYRPVQVPRVITETDVAEARSTYGGVPVGAPERGQFRRALLEFDLERVERSLRRDHLDAAFAAFRDCLALFDAAEVALRLEEPRLAQAAGALARAFSRRGAEREVLTALAALQTLSGNSPRVAKQIDDIHAWLDEASRADPPSLRAQRLIDDYEAVVRAWPSPPVVERLHALYMGRQAVGGLRGGLGGGQGIREMLAAHASLLRTGFNLGRLYLRVDRSDRALQALKAAQGHPGEDPEFVQLLEKALAPDATSADWLAIARRMGVSASQRQGQPEERTADLDASLRVCRHVIDRFPRDITGYLCAGEMSFHTGRRGLAVRIFEAAHAIDPARREPYDALSILYYQRFRGRLSEEMLADAKNEVANLERLHATAKQRWPEQPLQPPLAASYLELGRGFYNAGRSDDAIALYQRSIGLEPLAEAHEQLGLVHLKRGDAKAAIEAFERAGAMPHPSRQRHRAWEARALRLIGDANDAAGRADAATASWRASRAIWNEILQGAAPQDDRLPDIHTELGRIHLSLGETDEGIRRLEQAVDADPSRSETYVDALAFLAPRGHLEALREVYHRALARPDADVSEYFKAYAAFWVLDLERLRRLPPDGATLAYVEQLDGTRWYHQLARLVLGKVAFADLWPKADAPGKKTELLYYESMRRLTQGDRAGAAGLWHKVIGTGMMGYFEYDMAVHYLRHGPPLTEPPRAPRAAPRPSRRHAPRPPGGASDGSL